jgi:L-lactate dehydrogenase complex protein LldG
MTLAAESTAVDLFLARCQRLGVHVHPCGLDGIVAATIAALAAEGARSAIVADDLGAERPELAAALVAAGVAVITGATAAEAEPAEAGISRAPYAVAETGSVAVVGSALQPRLATMLPPIHLALVDRATILSTLAEAAAAIERAMTLEGTRFATLVTGPSRTADVEKTLAVGVHGPRALHVVLIDGASEHLPQPPSTRAARRRRPAAPARRATAASDRARRSNTTRDGTST